MQFGILPNGERVDRHTIIGGGLQAEILTYGSVVQDLRIDGWSTPLVLGFETLEPYLTDSPYFGATAGRCANRITNGKFSIDGKEFQTDQNYLGKHTLHGGSRGVGKRNWTISNISSNSISLKISICDDDMGFPGNMDVKLVYSCLEEGIFDLKFTATTDAPTLCSFAHHSYWNLDGQNHTNDHILQVVANDYVAVDEYFIPTGDIFSVHGTRFDFRKERPIADENIIDHNLCLSHSKSPIRQIGYLRSNYSGIQMDLKTTETGLQVYDGNKLNVSPKGLEGRSYSEFSGICLEPQSWPDSVNHSTFPDTILRPNQTYEQHTQYVFSNRKN